MRIQPAAVSLALPVFLLLTECGISSLVPTHVYSYESSTENPLDVDYRVGNWTRYF